MSHRDRVDDAVERTRIFTKLFTLYPIGQARDARAVLLAHIEETRDVPAHWLTVSLAALVREPGRQFAPTVGEIRGQALKAIRQDRRQRHFEAKGGTGDVPAEVYPYGEPAPNERRELAYARVREFERHALAAGLPVELRRLNVPEQEPATAGTFHAEPGGPPPVKAPTEIVAPGGSGAVDDVEDMP